MYQLPPIDSDSVFEELIKDLFNSTYKTNSYLLYGRQGQKQSGVDIYSSEQKVVIQAKKKDIVRNPVTVRKEIIAEIHETITLLDNFDGEFSRLVIASTFKNDAQIQNVCNTLCAKKDFSIEYWGWDAIKSELNKFTDLRTKYYPSFIKEVENDNEKSIQSDNEVKKTYDSVPNYIRRRVTLVNHETKHQIISFDDRRIYLSDVVTEGSKILLLASGGTGKTVELMNLAHNISEDKSSRSATLVSLKDFTTSIEELLQIENPHWERISGNDNVILLDSLDEVHSSKIDSAFSEINKFSKKHPDYTIVVSCRTNIYDIRTSRLEKFSICLPVPLSDAEIKSFLKLKLNNRVSVFLTEVKSKKIQDILHIPFYLKELIDIFISGNSLPDKRYKIYDQFFEKLLEKDRVKFVSKGLQIENHSHYVKCALLKIALTMEYMEKNVIPIDELQQIVVDAKIREIIIHSSMLTKSTRENLFYFDSNIFQEFLASKLLVNQPIDIIYKYLFSAYGSKVKRSWVNTLSFLFDQITEKSNELKDQFIQKLLSDDKESLVYLEPDKISKEIREQVFYEIVKSDWGKGISIFSNKFDLDKFSEFSGQTLSILNFLLHEINNPISTESQRDALYLLGSFKKLFGKEGEIKNTIHKIITDSASNIGLRSLAIEVLGKLKISDPKSIKLIKSLEFDRYGHIGNAIFSYILSTNQCESSIELIIKGLKNIRQSVLSGSSNSEDAIPYNGSYNYTLKSCIEQIKSRKPLLQIVNHFIDNPNQLEITYTESIIDDIVNKMIELHKSHKSVFNYAIRFYKSLVKATLTSDAYKLRRFFSETGTKENAFKLLHKQSFNGRLSERFDSTFADSECIDNYIKIAQKKKYSTDELQDFLSGLGLFRASNQDLYKEGVDKIEAKFGKIYNGEPYEKFIKRKEDATRHALNILFNKELLLYEIDKFFSDNNITEITWDQLHKIVTHDKNLSYAENELKYQEIAYKVIRSFTRTNPIPTSLSELYSVIRDEHSYTRLKLHRIIRTLNDYSTDIFSANQKEWIKKWCFDNIRKIDFSEAYVIEENGSTKTNYTQIYLGKFYKAFSFDFPKQKIVEMLLMESRSHYKDEKTLTDIILERIEFDLVKKQILLNLRNKKVNGLILQNHIRICKKYGIVEAKDNILKEFRSNKDISTKSYALKVFIHLGGTTSDLETDLRRFKMDDSSMWFFDRLFDFFIEKKEFDVVSKKLLCLAKNCNIEDNNYIKLYCKLLKAGNIEGLKMQAKLIKHRGAQDVHNIHINDAAYEMLPIESSCDTLYHIILALENRFKNKSSWISHYIKSIFIEIIGTSYTKLEFAKEFLTTKFDLGKDSPFNVINYWFKEFDNQYHQKIQPEIKLQDALLLNNNLNC
ncbi:MAG TPA: hypothetical protein PKN75_12745 [Bacteroidia bacterium]|nr:hypothetical protein [Bacteroidia bacterium]